MKKQIKESIKQKRLYQIFEQCEKITKNRFKRFIGTKQRVLIEERVSNEDLYIGRFWGQAPEVDGLTVVDSIKAEIGEFLEVEIKKLNEKDFYAAL